MPWVPGRCTVWAPAASVGTASSRYEKATGMLLALTEDEGPSVTSVAGLAGHDGPGETLGASRRDALGWCLLLRAPSRTPVKEGTVA